MSWKKKFVRNWGRLGMKFNTMIMEDALDALIDYRGKTPKKSKTGIMTLSAKSVKNNHIDYSQCYFISEEEYEKFMVRGFPKKGDILLTTEAPLGLVARLDRNDVAIAQRLLTLRGKENVLDNDYLLYYLQSPIGQASLKARETGTTVTGIKQAEFRKIEIEIPDYEVQKKVSGILRVIDQKIELNNAINNNLEEQLSALFVNMFGHFIDSLDNSDIKLGDLIESVDNRGKTPPLSDEPTDYPIIDVRALSGNSRIIDYANCTKYVSKETYNNWFRSGHPKEYDILISTVGSLAEMKIFLGTTGCIAQNVVGFRTKGISPLYLYQYLNYIKNDLVAYNIGSVQPSIKVTHIIKHSIYVASKEDVEIFDSIAQDITKKIFVNCQDNEALKQIRDTLLPKLMSGELDVSNIEI